MEQFERLIFLHASCSCCDLRSMLWNRHPHPLRAAARSLCFSLDETTHTCLQSCLENSFRQLLRFQMIEQMYIGIYYANMYASEFRKCYFHSVQSPSIEAIGFQEETPKVSNRGHLTEFNIAMLTPLIPVRNKNERRSDSNRALTTWSFLHLYTWSMYRKYVTVMVNYDQNIRANDLNISLNADRFLNVSFIV